MCVCVFEGVARVEMSWCLSMVPMHWVFEYPRSRLYTYLSLSLPSGMYLCASAVEGHTCKYCEQYALLTSHQGST